MGRISFFQKIFKWRTQGEPAFERGIVDILGFRLGNVTFFYEAFSVKSSGKDASGRDHERLEFLGDAVLGSIMSAYLFENYPSESEGFLSKMKSKIVSRENLNSLGESLGLRAFIRDKSEGTVLSRNICGDLLEALIGAVYLDVGYRKCEEVVLGRLFTRKSILELEDKIISYKSLLLEWGQKQKEKVRFDTKREDFENGEGFGFRSLVLLGQREVSCAFDLSKKKSEEAAARKAYCILNQKEPQREN